MARPFKWRRIDFVPTVSRFRPDGPGQSEEINLLKLEELEAIRLKDMEGLEQSECAERMAVSRPTFQRILSSAREKVADSLINGKSIQIDGGHFRCSECPKDLGQAGEYCRRRCRYRGGRE